MEAVKVWLDGREVTRHADAQGTLLSALAEAGLAVRFACRNGVCRACRCRLVAGEIDYRGKIPHGLWEKHIRDGYILPCIAYPVTDLEIEDLRMASED